MIVEIKVRYNPFNDGDVGKTMLDGAKWKSAVWDIDQELRKEIKYGEHPDAVAEAYEKIRSFLRDTLNADNLSLDN